MVGLLKPIFKMSIATGPGAGSKQKYKIIQIFYYSKLFNYSNLK